MLDLSSKTATYATSATDPMYYPLYVANKWVDPLDRYLGDAKLTDNAWFRYEDIFKAWRDAARLTANRTEFRTTEKSPCRSTARICTTRKD